MCVFQCDANHQMLCERCPVEYVLYNWTFSNPPQCQQNLSLYFLVAEMHGLTSSG